jgi:REP-associated tyrosine transposase
VRAPFTRLYIHCVWATWDRLPLITSVLERAIGRILLAKARELQCDVVALKGMPDHFHLLMRIPTTICVADLVKEVKGASSHFATHEVTPGRFFKWQGGYGAFSVSPEQVPTVRSYVERQEAHHTGNHVKPEWEQMSTDTAGPGE